MLVHPASRFVLRILVGELFLQGQFLGGVLPPAGLLEQLPFRRGGIEFREFVALRPCGRGSECDGEKGSDSVFMGTSPNCGILTRLDPGVRILVGENKASRRLFAFK